MAKKTTTETVVAAETTLNRDNLRALAAELNQLGIKEILGFTIKSKQDKGALLLDLEDAVNEIFVAQRNKDIAGSIQRPGAQAAWDTLALRFIMQHPLGANKSNSDSSVMHEAEDVAEKEHSKKKDKPKKSMEEIAEEVATRADKKAEKKASGDKKPRDTFWTWIADRMLDEKAAPPTRTNLLAEMAVRSPNAKPKSLATCLAGVKSWKWTKLNNLLIEDKDGLFTIGESRK